MKQPHLPYEKKHSIPLRLFRVCTHRHSGAGINHHRKFIYTAVPQDSCPQVLPWSTVSDEQNTADKAFYSGFPSDTKLDQNILVWVMSRAPGCCGWYHIYYPGLSSGFKSSLSWQRVTAVFNPSSNAELKIFSGRTWTTINRAELHQGAGIEEEFFHGYCCTWVHLQQECTDRIHCRGKHLFKVLSVLTEAQICFLLET